MATKNSRPCDLCGRSGRPLKQYLAAHVCDGCGFVFVPERRSPGEIAEDWSEIYAKKLYDPTWPGVRARLFYVAEWLDQRIGLKGKAVLDIGAGDGFFLEQVKARGGHPVGLDPSWKNALAVRARDIHCFRGWVGEVGDLGQYDIVTLNWTLENCGDCLAMLRWAKDQLAPGGHVAVATGSRLLVPFKKPMSSYFGQAAPDLHCFRWSSETLRRAISTARLWPREWNDFRQRDELLVVSTLTIDGLRTAQGQQPGTVDVLDETLRHQWLKDKEARDNPLDVHHFFEEWEKFEWS